MPEKWIIASIYQGFTIEGSWKISLAGTWPTFAQAEARRMLTYAFDPTTRTMTQEEYARIPYREVILT